MSFDMVATSSFLPPSLRTHSLAGTAYGTLLRGLWKINFLTIAFLGVKVMSNHLMSPFASANAFSLEWSSNRERLSCNVDARHSALPPQAIVVHELLVGENHRRNPRN
jgi:hypothetical protein